MIKFLHELNGEEVGGKAKGLKVLKEIGLSVPEACVLVHPTIELLDDDRLKRALDQLGKGPKAVRSSAVSEDGAQASFAGQFDTFLNLRTFEEIKQAIHKCIQGAHSDQVKEYASNLVQDADLRISVVLQNMVHAKFAGVIFSANPVTNRRDKMLINAVEGIGESLVSGSKDAVQYEVYRSGSNIADQIKLHGNLLSESILHELIQGAKHAELVFHQPVDMEWAVDQNDKLQWLQVRPVTTLDSVHYNELDTIPEDSTDVWTLGNIGEMMPGVATPLTYSVSAEAIDYGMVYLAEKGGAFKLSNRKGKRYIQMFYNRLFINMSNMMDYPKNIWLNKPSDVQFALSGKVFPGFEVEPEAPLPRRMFNFYKQLSSAGKAQKHLNQLRAMVGTFSIDCSGSLPEIHQNLTRSRHQLGIGFGHHLITSAQSGTLYSAFIRIMTNDKRQPEASDHHIATMLLLDIPEIESADAIKSLEKFAHLIAQNRSFAMEFTSCSPEKALHLLEQNAPQQIKEQFDSFLERHGHRCVRESELREKTWKENPVQLIHSLQTRVRIGEVKYVRSDHKKEVKEVLGHVPWIKRMILRNLIPSARRAVARREITKALSIKMVSIIRTAYHQFAEKLVTLGLLDEVDQIYFLTHEELALLIQDQNQQWKSIATKRRAILPELDQLVFDEICFGKPEPMENEVELDLSSEQLRGIPVSGGVMKGRVRIVNTLAEADQLQEGEIMVASFTDIGWTPYFSIIAGLITEIGSPLSHGAVVAREYGIPAVVGAKGAKKFLTNGTWICLDGNRGIIEKCQEDS